MKYKCGQYFAVRDGRIKRNMNHVQCRCTNIVKHAILNQFISPGHNSLKTTDYVDACCDKHLDYILKDIRRNHYVRYVRTQCIFNTDYSIKPSTMKWGSVTKE